MSTRTTQTTGLQIICPICRASNRPDARFCQQCGSDVLLDDIYRITKIIKSGGMGIVYKAIDASGAEYAVKEMHDQFATQSERDDGIMRFVEEAQLLRALDHPSIPKVFRSFIDEGRYYLSMEFIHGEDLEDMVKREGRVDEATVLQWADRVFDVLEYMHSAGLIYRDMKPSNIMLDRDGQVKIIDFGIAKLLQPGQRNTMVGTPGYSPPEQYQGLATVQSDIYATGATLHHLLTGRDPREHPPFSFPFATTLNPAITMRTAKAIDKALQMEVADRFHTIEEFRRALPIPTGERTRTRTFDPRDVEEPRTVQRPSVPVVPPPPVAPPQRRSAQPPQTTAASQAQTAAPPAPPRRRARTLRRVVTAAVLAAGLAGAGVVVAPEVLPVIQSFISDVSEPVPVNPPVTLVSQSFRTTVTVKLPEGTPDAEIRAALQQEYIKAGEAQYPGAVRNTNFPLAVEGGIAESDPVEGVRTYTATISGFLSVPQTP
jgi:serine/threonine protein kinase